MMKQLVRCDMFIFVVSPPARGDEAEEEVNGHHDEEEDTMEEVHQLCVV